MGLDLAPTGSHIIPLGLFNETSAKIFGVNLTCTAPFLSSFCVGLVFAQLLEREIWKDIFPCLPLGKGARTSQLSSRQGSTVSRAPQQNGPTLCWRSGIRIIEWFGLQGTFRDHLNPSLLSWARKTSWVQRPIQHYLECFQWSMIQRNGLGGKPNNPNQRQGITWQGCKWPPLFKSTPKALCWGPAHITLCSPAASSASPALSPGVCAAAAPSAPSSHRLPAAVSAPAAASPPSPRRPASCAAVGHRAQQAAGHSTPPRASTGTHWAWAWLWSFASKSSSRERRVSLMGREYAQQALLGHSCPFWKECCPRSSTHWGSANHEPPRPFLSKSSDVGGHSLGKYAGQTQVRRTPVGLLTLSTLPAPRQRFFLHSCIFAQHRCNKWSASSQKYSHLLYWAHRLVHGDL